MFDEHNQVNVRYVNSLYGAGIITIVEK